MTSIQFRRMNEVLIMSVMMGVGCGVHPGTSLLGPDEAPQSNEAVARRVLAEAWSALAIPSAAETGLTIRIAGDSASALLVRQTAIEKLSALGYTIKPDNANAPRVTVIVDTLVVVVTVRSGIFQKESVERTAHAALTVTFDTGDSLVRVYRLSGDYRGHVPASQKELVRDKHTYVLERRVGRWLSQCAKPLGFAVFMTVFAWSLYSYHG